jgi:hypothetical protein
MKYTPDGSLTYHVKHNSTTLQLVLSEDVSWEQRILGKDRFDSIRFGAPLHHNHFRRRRQKCF